MDTRLLEQGSNEWKAARLGHVTASCIIDVLSKGASRANYMRKLAAERLTGNSEESFVNTAMQWGIEQEPYARIAYEVSRETFVEKTGFWKHPTIPWFGASPDGLVGSGGLIEIKCPNTTTHLEYWFDNSPPMKYYKQMQCQLFVTNRQWCDFISFDPRLANNKLFVIRIERDEKLIKLMEQEILRFLEELETLLNKFQG